MSEMVERVARAMCREFSGSCLCEQASRVLPSCQDKIVAARTAIEAMREPTEAMVQAGYTADNGEDRNLGEKGARECWALMIDEALK